MASDLLKRSLSGFSSTTARMRKLFLNYLAVLPGGAAREASTTAIPFGVGNGVETEGGCGLAKRGGMDASRMQSGSTVIVRPLPG